MDTKSIASFKAVYECGSMAKASEKLFITPQGLSRTISALEAELGQQLFSRTNRGVEPTAFARSIYPKASRIGALLDAIADEAAGGASRSVLEVASVSGGLAYLGQRFVRDFMADHPGIELRVDEGNDRRVATMVADGLAECGFIAGPVDYTRFSATLFARHPHCAIVRSDDPLAGHGRIGFDDLAGRRIAIMGPGFSPYSYIQGRFARDGVAPAEFVGVAEISTALFMLSERDPEGDERGPVAITVDFACPPGSRDDLTVLPFSDTEFTWDEYFIVPAGDRITDEAAALRDFAIAWYARNEATLFPWRGEGGDWRLYGQGGRRPGRAGR